MSLAEKRSMYVAMELSKQNWKLAFGDGSTERLRTVRAGDQVRLLSEVASAKEKFGLPADARVASCYEAGRDGFWIARMLKKNGLDVYVMDPASIEVPRRARQRKTDRLDAKRLLELLIRFDLWGQRKAFAVVRIPTVQQEAEMRLHRERARLVNERGQHRSRIHALFNLHGIQVRNPLTAPVACIRDWEGNLLAQPWVEELRREQERLRMVQEQIHHIEQTQQQALADPQTQAQTQARKLCALRGVGPRSSWLLTHECFGWRTFRNRKKLGSFAGLTGTPFDSGETLREQGISKAGSARVRTTMIELAWGWVRWQPDSALTHWFIDHYVRGGSKRSRRKGIVALARKLLIALWKYLEEDQVPAGARLSA